MYNLLYYILFIKNIQAIFSLVISVFINLKSPHAGRLKKQYRTAINAMALYYVKYSLVFNYELLLMVYVSDMIYKISIISAR
jgi:hypothetical protein